MIIEFLYDNFLLIIAIAVIVSATSLFKMYSMMIRRIGTKLLILRKTTADIVPVRENIGDGVIWWKKRVFRIFGTPVLLNEAFPSRLYVTTDESDTAFGPNELIKGIPEITPDMMRIRTALETELAEQAMRGLGVGMRQKVWFILQYIFMGFLIGVVLCLLWR